MFELPNIILTTCSLVLAVRDNMWRKKMKIIVRLLPIFYMAGLVHIGWIAVEETKGFRPSTLSDGGG